MMPVGTPEPNSGTIDTGTVIVYFAVFVILGFVLGLVVLMPQRPSR